VSGIPQSTLVETAGAPTDPSILARALGEGWRGGYVPPDARGALLGLGRPWIGELFEEGARMGHFVVVDGVSDGVVFLRDPWGGGTSYQMALGSFRQFWTGRAVFK